MSLLDDLFRSGTLRVLDHALAQSLRRLDPATPDTVLAAAALASFAVGQGNAAFDPAQPQRLFDAAIDWPAPQAWIETLSESRWVGRPEASASASGDTPRPECPCPLPFFCAAWTPRPIRPYPRP